MRKILVLFFITCFCFIGFDLYAQSSNSDDANSGGTAKADVEEGSKNPEEYLLPPTTKKEKADPQSYTTGEFAPWAYFTVRFFAVTVGSFPFCILLGGIGFDLYKTGVESDKAGKFEPKYLPLFFGGAEKPKYTSDEVGTLLLTAVGISLGVGVIDLIIGLVKHFRKQEINELFLSTTK